MYKIIKKEMVDTISIPLLYLTKGVNLVHKVKLSKPTKDNKRDYYHKEFIYHSKYNDAQKVTTLKLVHSSFLCIDGKRGDDTYDSLIINMNNRDFIYKQMKKMKKILKLENIFIEKETVGFIVNPKLKNESIISFEAYTGKAIVLLPCVISYEDKESIGGVSIYLNPKTMSHIDLPIDTFKTMIKIIKKFDFHQAGLLAVNYLQATEIGNHEFDMSVVNFPEEVDDLEPVVKMNNRPDSTPQIPGFAVSKGGYIPNKGW